jgi:NitT/TauT family transport system substrate-binding protein
MARNQMEQPRHRMTKASRTLPSFVATLLLAAAMVMQSGMTNRAAAQKLEPVTVTAAVISVTVSIWPAIVAKEKGYFDEEGIKLDIINSGASSRALQQVAAGAVNIGSSSMVDTVRAIDGGAGVQVFINSLAVGTHSLIAAKTIKSVADLKGKRVMTGGAGDITNIWWYAMAKHYGLDPVKDVDLMFSGSTPSRLAALAAGGIEATVLSTPQSFTAVEQGFTDLGPVAPYLGEFPMMIWHVNNDWAKANEKTLLAFVRAHNKAVRYMIDPKNRQEVSELLAKASGSSLEDSLKTWDICVKINAFVADGAVTDATVMRVADTLLASGDIKEKPKGPGVYFNDRFIKGVK